MASADFGIEMVMLIAGIALATVEIWWRAIAEAFAEEGPDEPDSGHADQS